PTNRQRPTMSNGNGSSTSPAKKLTLLSASVVTTGVGAVSASDGTVVGAVNFATLGKRMVAVCAWLAASSLAEKVIVAMRSVFALPVVSSSNRYSRLGSNTEKFTASLGTMKPCTVI